MKKEENGEALAGAIIGLFLTDGTESLSWPPFPQRTAAFPQRVSLMANMWFVKSLHRKAM